ncbi:MAG TPA: hypothetical protein PK079_09130 [Leptospiraceae bacterium]|nr:hypothetical protein [Leptospiraceae bacterium]HMX32245.1 hypothetical protein [Leptospiraceae bacterium]HMY32372.1 hypothetical protein [Leptospiraceae bacterium]HMZ65586.1 hypothetical protein [Leptospiraceae bacterium]HNA06809.1 hypothetical protein [Leptospiraceae bacterium]
MLYTNKELETHFPLSERMKLEKMKAQNSPVYWMNEYIAASIEGADDVQSLVSYSKNVTEQLESVYADIEPFLKKTSDIRLLADYIRSLEDQVEDLYQEKEEAILSFEGVKSISDLVNLAKGMEEQLKSLYKEREENIQ